MVDSDRSKPAAIVLGESLTALATARCLSRGNVVVYSAASGPDRVTSFSRHCKRLYRPSDLNGQNDSTDWLTKFCATLPHRPVLIPTGDQDALWLALHAETLRPYCRLSTNTLADMVRVVSKDGLYAAALQSGVPVLPYIVEPTLTALADWSLLNAAPYLLKPFFGDVAACNLRAKNRLINGRAELLNYVARQGSRALIVQRKLDGGDGFILDCYGLCDAQGVPVTMASHRRLRQYPPNFGSTSFGEIPLRGDDALEAKLFDYTGQLLKRIRHHGVFGIEWLHEPTTGELYVIDFNARPFSSIGHLGDCGLNLPLLAYRDLIGDSLDDVAPRPKLAHSYWMNILRDALSVRSRTDATWKDWLTAIFFCRTFAVWDWGDPGPWFHLAWLELRDRTRTRFTHQHPNEWHVTGI